MTHIGKHGWMSPSRWQDRSFNWLVCPPISFAMSVGILCTLSRSGILRHSLYSQALTGPASVGNSTNHLVLCRIKAIGQDSGVVLSWMLRDARCLSCVFCPIFRVLRSCQYGYADYLQLFNRFCIDAMACLSILKYITADFCKRAYGNGFSAADV